MGISFLSGLEKSCFMCNKSWRMDSADVLKVSIKKDLSAGHVSALFNESV